MRADQQVLVTFVLLFALVSCEAIVPFHALSAEYDEERAVITFAARAAEAPALTIVSPGDGANSGFLIPPSFFELRFDKLFGKLGAATSRPASLWQAKTAGSFFAEEPRLLHSTAPGMAVSLEVRPAISGFTVERWLGDVKATSLDFSLTPEGSGFLVTLESVTVLYSRCKVADRSWRNWWSRIPLLYGFGFDIAALFGSSYGDQAIDLQASVIIGDLWTDLRGEAHVATVAQLDWTVLDVPLGKPFEVHQRGGWLPAIPPAVQLNADGRLTFGRGTFTISAFVTEQDDFAPEYLGAEASYQNYIDDVLRLLPIPGAPALAP